MPSQPRIITITGPSGSGKTTLVSELLKDPCFFYVTGLITRPQRPIELPGESEFVPVKEFRRLNQAGELLWALEVHGNWYGARRSTLQAAIDQLDRIGVMILTPEGTATLRVTYPDAIGSVFIVPPQANELRRRLKKRGDLTTAQIEQRLSDCAGWLAAAQASHIPYVFIDNSGSVAQMVHQFYEQIDRLYTPSLEQ